MADSKHKLPSVEIDLFCDSNMYLFQDCSEDFLTIMYHKKMCFANHFVLTDYPEYVDGVSLPFCRFCYIIMCTRDFGHGLLKMDSM